jgi:S1-C subfamily serine protease
MAFVANLSGLNIVLDRNAVPDRDARITLKCHDLPPGDALALILRPHGLTYAVRNEALFISNEEGVRTELAGWRLEPFDKRRAETYQAIRQQLEKPCTVDFADTPLEDAVRFLADFSEINVMLDPALQASRRAAVTVRLQGASTKTVLRMVAYLTDTRMVFQNVVLMLTSGDALETVEKHNLVRAGTGVAVQPDGYILTRLNTVEQAREIWVTTADGKTQRATVVDTNPKAGTALLKIEREGMPFVRKN